VCSTTPGTPGVVFLTDGALLVCQEPGQAQTSHFQFGALGASGFRKQCKDIEACALLESGNVIYTQRGSSSICCAPLDSDVLSGLVADVPVLAFAKMAGALTVRMLCTYASTRLHRHHVGKAACFFGGMQQAGWPGPKVRSTSRGAGRVTQIAAAPALSGLVAAAAGGSLVVFSSEDASEVARREAAHQGEITSLFASGQQVWPAPCNHAAAPSQLSLNVSRTADWASSPALSMQHTFADDRPVAHGVSCADCQRCSRWHSRNLDLRCRHVGVPALAAAWQRCAGAVCRWPPACPCHCRLGWHVAGSSGIRWPPDRVAARVRIKVS
jgi:hypothetical protein